MKFVDKVLVDGESMGASITSDEVLIDQIYGYAVQCVYTGSPNGSIKIQTSCQIVQGNEAITDWDDLSGATQSITTSGSVTFNCDAQFYKYFRVVYTRSSGTGALTVTYNGKG